MKNKSAEVCVHILSETDDGLRVCEDEGSPEDFVWIAKSHVELDGGDTVDNYGAGDTLECRLPMWVATQKGLI